METIVEVGQLEKYLERGETGDAELFAETFRGQFVYDHSEKRWYQWTGNFWEVDRTKAINNAMVNTLANKYLSEFERRIRSGENSSAKYLRRAKQLFTRRYIDNVVELASQKGGIALTGDEWDNNPMLLGVNNGILDLTTGELRNSNPDEYLRVHSPIDWQGLDAKCPLWEKVVHEAFGEDKEMTRFIQRLFGYCLTGLSTEKQLPITWGEGSNAKTTIFEVIYYVMGKDYCIKTPANSIMESRRDDIGDSPKPFLYELRGKRIAWAAESKEGARMNIGLIKELTGGDSITVRTLHSRPITFNPTHKVMLMTNHKPHIPADDLAAWDRVLLIEFPIRFVDKPRNGNERKKIRGLQDRIKEEEVSGVLAWLVRGCLDWQKQGLKPPSKVLKATEEYRDEEDILERFIVETFKHHKSVKVRAGDAYAKYTIWCDNYGVPSMSLVAFGKKMQKKFEVEKKNHFTFYLGIGLD